MKISKDEAVYAVLKMVLNEQVSLRMVYDDLWLYYFVSRLGFIETRSDRR
jgi:hypothetical protein